MEYRVLGATGFRVSVLGFGCGNVGGLMVRGARADRERALARAIELGINYFDTAPTYGDGLSEQHLGEALRAVRPADGVLVGTKFHVPEDAAATGRGVAAAIGRSLEASLARLGLERVDLLQLHNPIGAETREGAVAVAGVLDAVLPALDRLRQAGKLRCYGITALGETEALRRVVGTGSLHTAQVFYNLLNPSAGEPVAAGYPGQDFQQLLLDTRAHGVGVIAVRALAAGALSGEPGRHPVALPAVAPIASGPDYAADVARARTLEGLVRAGHADSLVEAALRFPLGTPAVSTVLLGYSSLEQLEHAVAAVAKGLLPEAAIARLRRSWAEWAEPPGRA